RELGLLRRWQSGIAVFDQRVRSIGFAFTKPSEKGWMEINKFECRFVGESKIRILLRNPCPPFHAISVHSRSIHSTGCATMTKGVHHIAHFAVAFIDLLGQRREMRSHRYLPIDEQERNDLLRRTYGRVRHMQKTFENFYSAMQSIPSV